MDYHRYTYEQEAWIEEHYENGSPAEMAYRFNTKFGTYITPGAIRQKIRSKYDVWIPVKKKKAKIQTICWDCKKANASGDCEWANRLEPVDGWQIKKSRNADGDEVIKVISCPKFIAD